MKTNNFSLKFDKKNFKLEHAKVDDVISVLRSLKTSIIQVARQLQPEASEEDLKIGISGLSSGSISLAFCLAPLAATAFQTLTGAIRKKNPANIPEKALEGVSQLQAFANKYECEGKFWGQTARKTPLATIKPNVDSIWGSTFKGETSYLGEIIRVGGIPSTAKVRLSNGNIIIAQVPKKLAKDLAKHLYKEATLFGIAEWSSSSCVLVGFKILGFEPFVRRSVVEGFDVLREKFGKYFKDVDPNDFSGEKRDS